ncbi:jg238 [Pararge aegeria aegeria]|uniref:Jg238 protein n=1 Tax=Pararge aegeria aegeria TaxID=348720 RepID=A0A8S4QLN8_9NEOP|nr:jg238 [Pararge aegeria aegeria]
MSYRDDHDHSGKSVTTKKKKKHQAVDNTMQRKISAPLPPGLMETDSSFLISAHQLKWERTLTTIRENFKRIAAGEIKA